MSSRTRIQVYGLRISCSLGSDNGEIEVPTAVLKHVSKNLSIQEVYTKYDPKDRGRWSQSRRYRGRRTNVGSKTYESHLGPVAEVLTQQ